MLLYFSLITPVSSFLWDIWGVSPGKWCRDYYYWESVGPSELIDMQDGMKIAGGLQDYCKKEDVTLMYVATPPERNPLYKKIDHWIFKDCLNFIKDTIIFKMYYELRERSNLWSFAKEFAQISDTKELHLPLCKVNLGAICQKSTNIASVSCYI
ncbi:unnamed protein product [Cylicocyclus nassatus]|uniref:Uncharacterized protein n=1 Tax=Cylicocyclus nassatus TaxID=53992 RepID=A0AA36M5P6_CYLNA|nr:unnamed protein product [Cylicocyclus nassatus]